MDSRYVTADGVPIVEGLEATDYDRRQCRVKIAGTTADPSHEFHKYWDGWFETERLDGSRGSLMNGERLSVRGY